MKLYLQQSVLEAARERIAFVFDHFERVHVSVSSGKDSTVLYHLAVQEATRRGRRVTVFFLDQEAEYEGTVVLMRQMMAHPAVDPNWYQVPIYMTNATSYAVDQLYAWGEGETWMRPKEPPREAGGPSIHAIRGKYPKRFYPFFDWYERRQPPGTAFLVGLRAEESLNRFRAVAANPGYDGPDGPVPWSTRTRAKGSFRFYPLYDWGMGDVWKFIADERVPYNRVYDLMYRRGNNFYNTMRVSNLIHEKSFSCLTDLQEIEPDTFERLIRRLPGPHVAAIYAREAMVFAAEQLPSAFATWRAYRDHLLETLPLTPERAERFRNRFASQPDTAHTHRQQVRQLLLGDHENSIPVTKPPKQGWREKWAAIL